MVFGPSHSSGQKPVQSRTGWYQQCSLRGPYLGLPQCVWVVARLLYYSLLTVKMSEYTVQTSFLTLVIRNICLQLLQKGCIIRACKLFELYYMMAQKRKAVWLISPVIQCILTWNVLEMGGVNQPRCKFHEAQQGFAYCCLFSILKECFEHSKYTNYYGILIAFLYLDSVPASVSECKHLIVLCLWCLITWIFSYKKDLKRKPTT